MIIILFLYHAVVVQALQLKKKSINYINQLLDTTIDEFNIALKAGVTGALIWCQQVIPKMLENKKGTILLTGATASLRGGHKFQSLAAPNICITLATGFTYQ